MLVRDSAVGISQLPAVNNLFRSRTPKHDKARSLVSQEPGLGLLYLSWSCFSLCFIKMTHWVDIRFGGLSHCARRFGVFSREVHARYVEASTKRAYRPLSRTLGLFPTISLISCAWRLALGDAHRQASQACLLRSRDAEFESMTIFRDLKISKLAKARGVTVLRRTERRVKSVAKYRDLRPRTLPIRRSDWPRCVSISEAFMLAEGDLALEAFFFIR